MSGVDRVNEQRKQMKDDGTKELLVSGAGMVCTGAVCVLLLLTVLGGYTHTGATTNAGWFALIVALMALPFGALLLALGVAKWIKNLRQR
jgi:high-affinity K+ transport system ATPase subunit B